MTGRIETKIKGFTLKKVEEQDCGLLMELIKELAVYEKMIDLVESTEALYKKALFEKKVTEAVIGEYEGKPVGYAIYFHNFSSFVGRPGIYLEDIYVRPEYRGRGFGKAMLAYVARLAVERDCGRLEWCVLDWNKPSIDFYRSLGAQSLDDWTIYRLDKDTLKALSEQF
jgi:GNAT superfamily N-acetyltransferase